MILQEIRILGYKSFRKIEWDANQKSKDILDMQIASYSNYSWVN